MIGIYQDDKLIKTYKSEEKASEFLPKILDELLKEYDFTSLIYANGPGSYMGIKISYVSLSTLSIVKNIPLFAVSAFELNGYKPISANKNFCFVYKEGEIYL
ncbi:TPA: tRNA threonylcarbamoyladenosine biosynthesis protein TsaB, partial [Campylobacter jejuni]|nr:tRNA threonylcarbamoyladenosine biosynthesis protein TsaB [Campylobacter jejuni]